MSQQSIRVVMQSSMQEKGWLLQAVCGLSPAFVRDSIVTPYFHCSWIRPTAKGNYAIEGVIGVIHAEFERLWTKRTADAARKPGYGVILDIANLRELSEKCWIEADSNMTAVESFCSTVAKVLERIPSNEQDLVKAFQENRLCGLPVDHFAGFSHREKFYAFKEFVASLGRDRAG